MSGKSGQYVETILKERREREARFKKSECGWLGLVGLFWLQGGENRVGSDKDNDIILPSSAPGHVGIVQYGNGVATFHAAEGVPVTRNGERVMLKKLIADTQKRPDFLQIGELTLVLLERAGQHLIRVWDRNSQLRKNFTSPSSSLSASVSKKPHMHS